MTDPKHIRDAYMHVARANHYLVTVATADLTLEELEAAEQLLISDENALCKPHKTMTLALDLCERGVTAKRLHGE